MSTIEFTWHEAKAASNLKKHGVTFAEATLVFEDPLSSTEVDCDYDERWITTGIVKSKLIVVIHEDDEETDHGQIRVTVRIISARFATPEESRAYRNDAR